MSRVIRSLKEEREMRQAIHDAVMALVKRAGELTIPREALEDLKAGDSMSVQVSAEGIVLRYEAPRLDAG